MKIDLVVPWVHESEEFQKERSKYIDEKVDKQATFRIRFKDNGELRYLLRSVETNASFIDRVFLVTNGQLPEWLNLKHPKLRLINHKQIFPADALPTFNTLAIESCLVNIPDLSDRFLYSNDDMFFANKVTEDFFFDKNGYPIIRFRKDFAPKEKNPGLYEQFVRNSLDKFEKKFNIELPYREHHNIDAYYKPDVIACIEAFKDEFRKTTYSKFRDSDNMRRIVWSCYSFYVGHSKIRLYPILKIPNKFRKIAEELFNLFRESKIMLMDRKKYSVRKHSRIKLCCLNDGDKTTDEDRARAIAFLENYFPKKSMFEI